MPYRNAAGDIVGDHGEVLAPAVMMGDSRGVFIPERVLRSGAMSGAGMNGWSGPGGSSGPGSPAMVGAMYAPPYHPAVPPQYGYGHPGMAAPPAQWQPHPAGGMYHPQFGWAPNSNPGACKIPQGLTTTPYTAGNKGRTQVLGFDSITAVAVAGTVIITQRPQTVFAPQRFVVSSAIAANFIINDVKVGKDSQFVSTGGVPAQMFTEVGVGVGIVFDGAVVAQDISVNVTNIDSAVHRFNGGIIGESCNG